MNFSVDGGSNFNVTKTSSIFQSYQGEGGENQTLNYDDSRDLAQSTAYQVIMQDPGNANEESGSGFLHLFDPSSTTFVKHFVIPYILITPLSILPLLNLKSTPSIAAVTLQ